MQAERGLTNISVEGLQFRIYQLEKELVAKTILSTSNKPMLEVSKENLKILLLSNVDRAVHECGIEAVMDVVREYQPVPDKPKINKQISNLQGENTILNIKLGQEEERVRELQDEIDKLKNPKCDCETQKWIEEQYED